MNLEMKPNQMIADDVRRLLLETRAILTIEYGLKPTDEPLRLVEEALQLGTMEAYERLVAWVADHAEAGEGSELEVA